MEKQIIGIKQLYRQLAQISEAVLRGQSYLVVKNSRPVFRIEPINDLPDKKYGLSDIKKIRFRGGKKLSEKIDNIIYGV